ncbi:19971_t:CDS:1, partial [Gigaspora margarita]
MLHVKQEAIVSSNLPYDNAISVVNSEIMKTLHIGDRPFVIFKFLDPLLGKDNFQVMMPKELRDLEKCSELLL